MAITIKRKEGENISNYLYRVSSIIRRSGVLLSARKKQFYTSKIGKRQKKESALHRFRFLKEVNRRQKLGLPIDKKQIKGSLHLR